MSNVDKMFEELGYTKQETFTFIDYTKKYPTHKATIEFNKVTKLIDTLIFMMNVKK